MTQYMPSGRSAGTFTISLGEIDSLTQRTGENAATLRAVGQQLDALVLAPGTFPLAAGQLLHEAYESWRLSHQEGLVAEAHQLSGLSDDLVAALKSCTEDDTLAAVAMRRSVFVDPA